MHVAEYIKSGDFNKVDGIKRRILSLYRNDIARYAQGYESKVISIFEEISSQLSKKKRDFCCRRWVKMHACEVIVDDKRIKLPLYLLNWLQ